MKPKPHIVFVEEGYRRSARAIKQAASLGYRISLIGSQAPKYVDRELVSYAIADPYNLEAIAAATTELNNANTIDGAVTLMERLPAVATINELLGLPGLNLDQAFTVQHKVRTRQALEGSNITQPRFEALQSDFDADELLKIASEFNYPVVVKPSGGAGGGGVQILEDPTQAQPTAERFRVLSEHSAKAYGYFPTDLIVEEFITGPQYSLDGFQSSGKSHLVSITEKGIEHQKIEASHLVGPIPDGHFGHAAAEFVERICSELGLENTVFHIEASYGASGWCLIEVNARLAGGCIGTDLIPRALGIDLVDIMCRVSTGETVKYTGSRLRKYAASTLFRGSTAGVISSIEGVPNALRFEGVVDVVVEDGIERVLATQNNHFDDRSGAIISVSETREGALSSGEVASRLIKVKTK